MTKIPHSPCTSCLSSNSLDTPVILADPSGRVAAGATAALLEVKAPPPASHAQRVGLVPALPKAPRTLPHDAAIVPPSRDAAVVDTAK